MEKHTDPYPHDAFSTPSDPTPGGPMVGGVLSVVDKLISMTEFGKEAFDAAWENLSFSTALDHMKNGVAVARKGWPKDCEGGLLLKDGKFFGAPVMVIMQGGLGLPVRDILANDWYILSEPKPTTP